MQNKILFPILFLAALINIAPLLLFDVGGDVDFHLVLIDCFARQFWAGDLYPRWCMDANTGLGAPIFLFYFPLPYYVSTLLYPLTSLGLSLYGLYVLCLALATFATGLSCFHWLKGIVSPGRALLAALLFLFMPYRMEAMLYRSSYTEVWLFALLPLFFACLRRAVQYKTIAPLALTIAAMILTHLPGAAVAFVAGGIYVLCMAGKQWRILLRSAIAAAWGIAIAAFYLVPAIYYQQFMAPSEVTATHRWTNTYLSFSHISGAGHNRLAVTIVLMLVSMTLLSAYMLYKRKAVPDVFTRRETVAFALVTAAAFFLLFPISAPVYRLIGPLAEILYPWRMQAVFALALTFYTAVWMHYIAGGKKQKTWKADFALLFGLMVLLAYFITGVREEGSLALQQDALRTHFTCLTEYRTQWMDKEQCTAERLLAREKKRPAFAQFIKGKGTVTANNMSLDIRATKDATLRLDYFYFPTWSTDGFTLHPETGSGKMLLNVPAGEHNVTLHYATWRGNPLLIRLAYALSLLSVLLFLFLSFPRRRESST